MASKGRIETKEVKLTDKQELFVEYYLQHRNATDAAKRAGYSDKTAYSIGQENLKKPEIAERISERTEEVAMAADEVLFRLAEQARGDHGRFWRFDENGRAVSLDFRKLLESGCGHLVKKFECHELTGEVTKVEFYDAQAAL